MDEHNRIYQMMKNQKSRQPSMLTQAEATLKRKLETLKSASGTHSPSIHTIKTKLPEIGINIDACFLSNPYATDLFMEHMARDLADHKVLRDYLEFYPSQNQEIASAISETLEVPSDCILIGNGAIELIQSTIHKFVKKKICVIAPTFSSYYEFINKDAEVVFYHLKKSNNYQLNVEHYIDFIKSEKPDTIVLINPNNPTGDYLSIAEITHIVESLWFVPTILLDESFIHFAYEDTSAFDSVTASHLVEKHDNLILIKSMSKDFGIAGIRVGYGLMRSERVQTQLATGFLWNSNGLAEYFLNLYSETSFQERYSTLRRKYIKETINFGNSLRQVDGLTVYPSKSNFYLVELNNGITAGDASLMLLQREGIYTRNCNDKYGLTGEFLRIASRTKEENTHIVNGINSIFKS